MTVPKSKKLQAEEEARTASDAPSSLALAPDPVPTGPVQVREVQCLNDFVAVLQFEIESSIEMPDADSKYKNEGLVVGVGPGVSDGTGGRLKPGVEVGDVVMFGGARNVLATIASDSPPYAGRKVVILSERNLLCKLHKKVPWEPFEVK